MHKEIVIWHFDIRHLSHKFTRIFLINKSHVTQCDLFYNAKLSSKQPPPKNQHFCSMLHNLLGYPANSNASWCMASMVYTILRATPQPQAPRPTILLQVLTSTMNSMQTCNSVTFYLIFKKSFSDISRKCILQKKKTRQAYTAYRALLQV